ncbi:MAG: 4Fe-4S dicluster domain-containing protein [Candidatus Heimdallarchaeota archaeon]|nr:4Fe-4S dicluster domain-containing protein [Candidatus Heimdallarchaeota archaeon]
MSDYTVIIDHGLCNLCEDCVEVCPEKVLEYNRSEEKILAMGIDDCNNCGACVEACFLAAIDVVKSPEKTREEFIESLDLTEQRANTLDELLKKYGHPDADKTAIPIEEVLTLLQFETTEELDDWLLDNYDKTAYFSGKELIILNSLPEL